MYGNAVGTLPGPGEGCGPGESASWPIPVPARARSCHLLAVMGQDEGRLRVIRLAVRPCSAPPPAPEPGPRPRADDTPWRGGR